MRISKKFYWYKAQISHHLPWRTIGHQGGSNIVMDNIIFSDLLLQNRFFYREQAIAKFPACTTLAIHVEMI